jgi:hypothetical protein
MIPDFIIIGTQKGGTSSLHYYLSQHPKIRMSVEKEIHFFDLNFNNGLEWYQRQFPKQDNNSEILFGESSPYYLFHPLVPERVNKICPKVKLIVMLRNPVDRAYSHYMMQKKKGIEEFNNFEDAYRAESARINDEIEKINSDPKYYSYNHQKFSYLARGRYFEQIERWLNYFPLSNFHFIKSELFFQDINSVLTSVYSFLGIEHYLPPDLSIQNSNEYLQMELKERLELEGYFKSDNDKLIKLLGSNFIW